MNKLVTITIVLILSSVVYLTSGCKKDNEPDSVEYVIKVDSIVHPDTIKVGEKLEVYFYGVVGPNDCYEFLRFVPGFGPNAINFTLYGLQTLRSDCEGDPIYMNGGGVALQDMTVGDWSIQVNQPDGVQPIMSSVYVRE